MRHQHKTHFFIPSTSSLNAGKTACGIKAWESSYTESEADITNGSRIDITRRVRDITCDTCRGTNPKQA